jgi:hypothetical protein
VARNGTVDSTDRVVTQLISPFISQWLDPVSWCTITSFKQSIERRRWVLGTPTCSGGLELHSQAEGSSSDWHFFFYGATAHIGPRPPHVLSFVIFI